MNSAWALNSLVQYEECTCKGMLLYISPLGSPEDVREEGAKGLRVSELDARCGSHSMFHERRVEQIALLCL